MKFISLAIFGAYLIELESIHDERGFFARSWCQKEFVSHGLNSQLAQCSISFNKYKGTLRGMHYQTKPHEEAKLIRCAKGAIYDVIIDLRAESPTFKQWIWVELTAENYKMLYVPEGLAHGFQSLVDHTEVFYQMSQPFVPDYARVIRWNDPLFKIKWPLDVKVISTKDKTCSDFKP